MKGEERRLEIVNILTKSNHPIKGNMLADQLGVSRQVIVQDIAILRANNYEILSTNVGYIIMKKSEFSRVFKVIHSDEETEKELNLYIDHGGKVEDVFVYHKAYGVVRTKMNIRTRIDVKNYIEKIQSGKSRLLKNVTSGYHYHTICADSEKVLDMIQKELQNAGFLAKLQDYEPLNFNN